MKQEVYAEEGYTEADFDRMRNVWKQMMVGEGYDAEDANVVRNVAALSASAQALWSSMVKDEGRKRLWSNLAFDTPARIHTNYKNIQTMAEAYATEGSALYQNDELAADIADAIEWLDVTGKYSATTSQFQNWWQWEIFCCMIRSVKKNECAIWKPSGIFKTILPCPAPIGCGNVRCLSAGEFWKRIRRI